MNILVAGVGGQGVLLFADIVSQLAVSAGLDVKKSEDHGMAQRGGSVASHVRFGANIASPLIDEGTADLVVAFEAMEGLRAAHFLAPAGCLVYDPHRINPLPVNLGTVERPTDDALLARIGARAKSNLAVPAFARALALGNARAQNVVMLGAVSHRLPFPVEACLVAIRAAVKPGALELNLAAFAAGRELAS